MVIIITTQFLYSTIQGQILPSVIYNWPYQEPLNMFTAQAKNSSLLLGKYLVNLGL